MRIGPSAPATSNQAPGKGDRPRMWASTSAAGRDQSMRASAGVILLGIGRLADLFRAGDAAALDGGQRPGPQAGADVRHALGQAGGGVVGADVHDLGQQDGPLVQTLGHAHDLDAGLAVAGHDGALDRGGAAPARQQRAMQVETAQTRRLQHLGLEDLAVGDDAGGIEIQALEGRRWPRATSSRRA